MVWDGSKWSDMDSKDSYSQLQLAWDWGIMVVVFVRNGQCPPRSTVVCATIEALEIESPANSPICTWMDREAHMKHKSSSSSSNWG